MKQLFEKTFWTSAGAALIVTVVALLNYVGKAIDEANPKRQFGEYGGPVIQHTGPDGVFIHVMYGLFAAFAFAAGLFLVGFFVLMAHKLGMELKTILTLTRKKQ